MTRRKIEGLRARGSQSGKSSASSAAAWAFKVGVDSAGRRLRELEPLSNERFGVHFTADAELRDLIERARALARHRLPEGDLASLMNLMVSSFVRHE